MANLEHARKTGRRRPDRLRFRVTVASRLMVALAATAALSAVLAMALHERTLASDLEEAARARLERAGVAANQLVEAHLAAMGDRYRAISATPQLRANLEVGDAPTLEYYARTLREREGAALLAFVGRDADEIAMAGDTQLFAAARSVDAAALVAHAGSAYAVVAAELRTSAGLVGRMLAAERIEEETLGSWAKLCGAELVLEPPGKAHPERLARSARSLGALDLMVTSSLAAEREALRHSRMSLVAAGSIAIALSLVACVLMARGFVRPILSIQHATDRIRSGDLDVRLASDRSDEIGDVARAFDLMLDGLAGSRREIERHLEELRRSRQHMANAQELARLGSFELDFEKGTPTELRGSAQLRTLLQVEPGEDPLDPLALLERVHPRDRDALANSAREALAGGNPLRIDFRVRLPDGDERIMHAQAQLTPLDSDDRMRLEGTVQDITERHHADERIRYLAHHDMLTGLGNRLHFSERLDLAIHEARRRRAGLGVLFVNLDQFKRVNDTLGQGIGDEALRRVAERLLRCLRETDVVVRGTDDETAVSRLAGDEFTLLVNDIDDGQDLALVAKRILHALGQPIELDGHELVLGASIGVSVWPSDGEDTNALIASADSAMRHAKDRGGNRYEFYDDSMNAAAMEMLDLEARIRRGLSQDEFEMHYQPKVALADGRITGYEALMRWRDPQAGLIGPGQFIPVAEQCGLIHPLGAFALRAACTQLAAWRDEFPNGSCPRVSVNLSAHQFKTGTLVQSVAEVLAETGAPPDRLEVEITETAVLHDEKGVVADLERLRGMGIAVSLDDFGTGQSSLSHLRRLPVDTLKIDMSFVCNIAHTEEDALLTSAIVAMGRARGLCVVAEGVETEDQRRLLAAWGCHEIQGFLISPALPAAEAIALRTPPALDS